MPTEHWLTTSRMKRWARRDAVEPRAGTREGTIQVASIGQIAGLDDEPERVDDGDSDHGAPQSVLASRSRSTLRTISTPFNSSPWIAPDSQTWGPGRLPLITATGSDSWEPVGTLANGSSIRALRPGATTWLADSDRIVAYLRPASDHAVFPVRRCSR